LLIAFAALCLLFNQAHSIEIKHGLVKHAGCGQKGGNSWQLAAFELPGAATTESLRFEVRLVGGGLSSFVVDDVSLCTTSGCRHPDMQVCP
jgi:hypothetical protein